MLHLCITPEREPKTRMLMEALAAGMGGRDCRVIVGAPPEDDHPFVVWGQEWLTLEIVPPACRSGRPFWTIDNGFWNPGRGTARGYYRFCYRGMTPILLDDPDPRRRLSMKLQPWREDSGYVLLAMPGVHFGAALGIDVKAWCDTIIAELYGRTEKLGRELRVRLRDSDRPLADDLRGAWALVTHSSNVAVDAVIAGVPVFVAATSAAAPVGRTDLQLAEPAMPPRKHWLASLASQHFTVPEMRAGVAWWWMKQIAAQVDGR